LYNEDREGIGKIEKVKYIYSSFCFSYNFPNFQIEREYKSYCRYQRQTNGVLLF